jgi:Contractile injection system tube protein
VAKLRITALEGAHQAEVFEAQFNPKEIEVERTIPWLYQRLVPAPPQFLGNEPARMSFELIFDGVKQSTSVQPRLDTLNRLSSVDESLHHPPKVRVAWGNARGALPTFDGVVEEISVHYVTFADTGVPLRATATVKITEAFDLSRALDRG